MPMSLGRNWLEHLTPSRSHRRHAVSLLVLFALLACEESTSRYQTRTVRVISEI